ncbi:MAG: hypothetical protein JW795_06050, partial [Chitinivibrionales bacterium]|nr:hypothetical protein [Chitinivibrionales bacterium]
MRRTCGFEFLATAAIVVLLVTTLLDAQPAASVFSSSGTVRLQRDQKKIWENCSPGDLIHDNDIIETFFQSKAVLSYGQGNVIILGSNTRLLLNIAIRQADRREFTDINITIFSGGVLVKDIAASHVGVYTSNAVAQLDSGTLSSVVETKTGHTGFQMLGGRSSVRNIENKQSTDLTVGLTSIVLPGKDPTAPLYMTYKHVGVLRHFFGETFINHEIDASGITPTEDVSSAMKLSLSQNTDDLKNQQLDNQMYKNQFSLNKIYGSILDDKNARRKFFQSITQPRFDRDSAQMLFSFQNAYALAAGGVYPYFSFNFYHKFDALSYGLRVPLARKARSALSLSLESLQGIFDKIAFITYSQNE